jgi:chitinase
VLQESSINTLLSKGAARNKLVLGIPLYGKIFKVKSTEGGVGFPKEYEGEGVPGPYMQKPGYRGYNAVSFCSCVGISSSGTE